MAAIKNMVSIRNMESIKNKASRKSASVFKHVSETIQNVKAVKDTAGNESGQSTRRSDEIRQRRNRQTASKKKAPVIHTVKPSPGIRDAQRRSDRRKRGAVVPALPPVMARRPAASQSTARMAHSAGGQSKFGTARNARRRYDLALNTQGAEMRLPSLPQVRVGWRWVSLSLAALLAFVLYQFWTSPVYQVDAAEVEGLKRLTSGDVNSALSLTGQPVFALNAIRIQEDVLDAFPEFSAVSVQVDLPHTVLITVTERLPILVWFQDGRSNLVDAEGVTFPLRDGSAVGQYPVVEASGSPPAISATDSALSTPVADIGNLGNVSNIPDIPNALMAKLPAGVPVPSEAKPLLSPGLVSAILLIAQQTPQESVLTYDPAHGLGWKDRRGFQVYLGDPQDMEMKMLIYQAVLERLKSSEGRPALISVEFVHAPYYRMEPGEE